MTTRGRKWALALVCALAVGLAGGAAVHAAASKPDFALGVNPTSQSIPRGQTASYTVTATAAAGFSGTVSLAASGQPVGTTATFSPASIALSTSVTSVTATLTLATSATTPVGSYSITISGVSGKLSHSITIGLTVNYPLSQSIALAVTPSSATVPAGSTAVYTVAITRTNFTGPVTLSVLGGLPAGATAAFSPDPATGNATTLQVTTSAASTPSGGYTLLVVGAATMGSTTQYAYAQAQLTVLAASNRSFLISGGPTGTLAPGIAPQPVNLVLGNPNNQALSVSNLTVTVTGTSAGNACDASNFTVLQYSGPYPVNLAANQTASLSQLGVPSAAWPRVGMLDLPKNQDACKGVTIRLAYAGSGQGA